MTDLSKYDFSRSRAVLAQIRNVLRCPLCQDVVVNPYSLGNCSHFFCQSCLDHRHSGGTCPATGCSALAPAKAAAQNKCIDSFTKSIFSIGKGFGEQIPSRVKRYMSTEIDEDENAEYKDIKDLNGSPQMLAPLTPTHNLKDGEHSKRKLSGPEKSSSGIKSVVNEGSSNKRKPRGGGATAKTLIIKGKENAAYISRDSSNDTTKRVYKGKANKPGISVEEKTTTGLTINDVVLPATVETPRTKKTSIASRRKVGSIEKRNLKGETSLHASTVKGDLNTVSKLLQGGSNPNTVDNAGWSPLHEAAIAGRTDLVELLLQHGASPNLHAAEDNVTPLHEAASAGFIDVVKLLVARGADTKAKNSQGQTPRDVAAGEEIVEALEQTLVEISSTQIHDQTVVQSDELSAEDVFVSCGAAFDSEFKKISLAASKLGLRKPSRAVTTATTHCLVDSSRDSLQILCAQLVGAIIVRTEWILQSKQIGNLVDTEPFLLSPADVDPEGRSRALENRARAQPKLMTGLNFYLSGTFDSPGKADLQRLITLSGAKLLNREPDPENLPGIELTVPLHATNDSSLCRTSHVILYQAGGKREPVIKYKMEHVKTLPVPWFTQSILHHQLIEPALFVQ